MRYRLAGVEDNEAIQTLLNQNSMDGGWLQMNMTRAPDFFVQQHYFGHEYPVLIEDEGQLVGMCQLTEQELYLNQQPTITGYLGALRIDPSYRRRITIFKKGFAQLKAIIQPFPDICYTSIASDNLPARRILEANLLGMPRYHFLSEQVTLVLPCSRGEVLGLWTKLDRNQLEGFCAEHNKIASLNHFSPYLTPEKISNLGANSTFWMTINQDGPAYMVLWNQQHFKQVRVQSYRFPLNMLRPFYNCYAWINKQVSLPKLHQVLDQSFMAFFAVADDRDIVPLIIDALSHCQSRILTLTLPADHPQLKSIIKVLKPVCYNTRVYQVLLNPQQVPLSMDRVCPEGAIL